MDQEIIWDIVQNEENFTNNFPKARQIYMVKKLNRDECVLNIGVGSGMLESLGLKKGVEMYSLDPSPKAIERLSKDLHMHERAQAGYAQSMPFSRNNFDAVVMSEVMEHLESEVLDQSLREVIRVLRPGGVFLASTPYKEVLSENRSICPGCGNQFHRWGHVQSFDRRRMRELLVLHNFENIKITVTTFVDWRRKGMQSFLKSIVRFTLAKMGMSIADPHLVVVARKKRDCNYKLQKY